jgi:hypothetical protein
MLREHARPRDTTAAAALLILPEHGQWKGTLTARYYAGDWTADEIAAGLAGDPIEEYVAKNILVNTGIHLIEDLLIGAGGTAYTNATSYIGVGGANPTALTGTIGLTNGSAAVTGGGTNFTGELVVGDMIRADTDGTWYRVASIASNTALTLATAYTGTTASGLAASREALAATQTDLTAPTNKIKKAMDATFPSRSGQTITWRATLGTSEGNYPLNEFGIFNGGPAFATGTMLNRIVQYLGTKSAATTLQLTGTVAIS